RTRYSPILLRSRLWRTRSAASRTPAPNCPVVCLTVKPVGEPDAGDRHVRFDERGWETARCRMAQATAPILDSTKRTYRGVCCLSAFGGKADIRQRSPNNRDL